MPQYVQVAGGPRIAFPDDATQEQIQEVMARDFAPASRDPVSVTEPPFTAQYDDNLRRAADNFESLRRAGLPTATGTAESPQKLAATIGRGFQAAGKTLYAEAADLGELAFANILAELGPPRDKGEPPSNLEAYVQGEPLPAERQIKDLPTPLRIPAEASRGFVEGAPQVAAVAGLEFAGVPAFVSAPAIFGSTPEGFDVKNAAVAAALPFVGRYSGELTGALARKLGVTTSQAETLWKYLGGTGGAATALAGLNLYEINKLPPEQRHEAMINGVASVFAQMAVGPIGVKRAVPGLGEQAGELLGQEVAGAGADNQAAIEQQAAFGPQAQIQPGSRPSGPPIVTPENLPPAKPAITPRPAIPRAPASAFKPTVPEGPPAEERVTVLEEIRRAGARTTRQVQRLFPKSELSREEAAALRRQAWDEQPPAAAPAETTTEQETAPVPEDIVGKGPTGAQRFAQEWTPKANNKFSTQVGLELGSVEELRSLLRQRQDAAELTKQLQEQAIAETDPQKQTDLMQQAMAQSFRAQLAREAIEVGTNSGSWTEDAGLNLGKRPLDWRENPEVASWLKANAKAAGITLPKQLEAPAPVERPAAARWTAATPVQNAKVSGHYETVEQGQLLASNNTGYDMRLQPRDRTRLASQQQIAAMAANLEPQRLGASLTTDTGAPIIDEANQVLSGNGRLSALRQVFGTGGQGAADYKAWLTQNAADFGLDPAQISRMKEPVLVRRATDYGKLDKVEFARQSNQQQVAGMSEPERAASDARMLASNPELLALFRPGEEGSVLAATNREFLNAFIKGTGDQAELTNKEGYNGPALTRRVRNAVLGALIGPENHTLLAQLLEEADSLGVKRAADAMISAAPSLVRLKGTPYDLSTVASQALKDLVSIRSTGQKLTDFLDNQELFTDPNRTAESDLLLRFLYDAKSLKAIAAGLGNYVQIARNELQAGAGPDIFGQRAATRSQLIQRVYGQAQEAPGIAGSPAAAQGQLQIGQSPGAPGQFGSQPGAPGQGPVPGPSQSPGQLPLGPSNFLQEQEGGYRPTPSPSNEPPEPTNEQLYALNAESESTRQADKALRTSQQNRDPDLAGAGPQLDQATAATPPKPRLFSGLRKIFAAATLDDDAAVMGTIIRAAAGAEYELARQADFAMRPYRREFDKTPVGRNWRFIPGQPLPRNYEVMRAIDTGETAGLTPIEADFAKAMRRLFDHAIDLVQEVSPESLRSLVENYFPRIWKDPARNMEAIASLLSRKPWEGSKSFLKKRVLEYFTEGLAHGLVPFSDNPADIVTAKLGEMYRFYATRRAIEEARARGYRKFVYIYEKPPGPNWRAVDDRSSTVFAPPTVTVKEAYDAQIRAKTLELLQSLGVPHERLVNIGGKRWGYAEPGTGRIVSKFGGPDFVIWHEFGHQMDFRYPDLRDALPTSGNSTLAQELRALADLRFGDQATESYKRYVRETPEKMANVFHAYVHAPELFEQTAPNVLRVFREWLDAHPEVKNPLNEIRPSLRLGVSEAQMFVGGPVLLGRWMMPEGPAQVLDNYLQPGLGRFPLFRSLRQVFGLLNGVQLFGFFHGGFVMNDSFYSGIGLSLYDVMQSVKTAARGDIGLAGRQLGRGALELAQIPISPLTSLYRGHFIMDAIANPAAANAEYRKLAQYSIQQNLRAGHGNFDPEFTRRWVRAFNEVTHEFSVGAAAEVFWRTPSAVFQVAMKPVMEWLVPRMKQGIMARMTERVITDNPEAGADEIRRRLGQAADATEDRLGQVTYDNLFQMRAVKDAMQLAMRAYGWQLTKYRMIGGGAGDWIRAGRQLAAGRSPEITFRMTYLPAMVLGHAILGSILQYSLTGRPPSKLLDYLFPESGLIDAFGQPVRLSIADFVKDVVADFKSFPHPAKMVEDFLRKTGPAWSMLGELWRDQDFWGTEIYSRKVPGEPELDHVMRNIWEVIQYLGKGSQPFSVRGSQRLAESGASAAGRLAPFIGVVPAPRYATMTKAETRAAEIMRADLPKMPQTKEQRAKGMGEAQIVKDIRTGKINNQGQFEAAAKAAGINPRDSRELTKLRERIAWSPLQYQVHKMSVDQAMEVFDLATPQERVTLSLILADKINNAFEGGRLEPDKARRYVALVLPYYKQAKAAARPKRPQPAPGPSSSQTYSAFSPQR